MNKMLKLVSLALIVGYFASSFDVEGMNGQTSEEASQPVTQSTTAIIPLGVCEVLHIDNNRSGKEICADIYARTLKLVNEDQSIIKWLANRWSMNRAQDCYDMLQSFDDDHKLEEFINKIRSEGFTIQFGDGKDLLNVGKSIDINADVRQQLYNEIKTNVFYRLDRGKEKATEILVNWYAEAMTDYIITNNQ